MNIIWDIRFLPQGKGTYELIEMLNIHVDDFKMFIQHEINSGRVGLRYDEKK